MWDDFEAAVRMVLMNVAPRTYVNVSDKENPKSLFVQFVGVEPDRNINDVEADLAPRREGEDFSVERVALLEELGFEELPENHAGLWQRNLSWPILSSVVAEVAAAFVLRLRDIGGVPDPGRLQYRAWRNPEPVRPGVWWTPDPGENVVIFPELDITVQTPETYGN